MSTTPDPTLAGLLAVHRYEVNALEASLEHEKSARRNDEIRAKLELQDVERARDKAQRETKNAVAAHDRVVADAAELDVRIERLEGVITSLRLELETERKRHAQARDARGKFAKAES